MRLVHPGCLTVSVLAVFLSLCWSGSVDRPRHGTYFLQRRRAGPTFSEYSPQRHTTTLREFPNPLVYPARPGVSSLPVGRHLRSQRRSLSGSYSVDLSLPYTHTHRTHRTRFNLMNTPPFFSPHKRHPFSRHPRHHLFLQPRDYLPVRRVQRQPRPSPSSSRPQGPLQDQQQNTDNVDSSSGNTGRPLPDPLDALDPLDPANFRLQDMDLSQLQMTLDLIEAHTRVKDNDSSAYTGSRVLVMLLREQCYRLRNSGDRDIQVFCERVNNRFLSLLF